MMLNEELMKEAAEFLEGILYVRLFEYSVINDTWKVRVSKDQRMTDESKFAHGWMNEKPYAGMQVVHLMGSHQFLPAPQGGIPC